MLRLRRLLLPVAGAVLALGAVPSQPAWAGDGVQCDEKGCDVTATTPTRPGGPPVQVKQDPSEPDPCTYRAAEPPPADSWVVLSGKGKPSGGHWYWKECAARGIGWGELMWSPDAPPTTSPQQLGQLARGRLNLPTPRVQVNPADKSIVGVPTWLSLAGSWRPITADARVPGVVVTATATPVSAVWSMGDGSTVRCTGPGAVFRPGVDNPKAASPDCGHTYRRSSARASGGAYTVTVTVTWRVTWSGPGVGGTLPNLVTTGSVPLRVAESQTVITD